MRLMPGPALTVLTVLVLALGGFVPGQAQAQEGTSGKPQIDCALFTKGMSEVPAAERFDLARSAIEGNCRPLSEPILSALRKGSWLDGKEVGFEHRLSLLDLAVSGHHAEAESLAVKILENGQWPDGRALDLETGGRIIKSMRSVLTPYRVRLLLDVYDQISQEHVRLNVLQTLRASNEEAALLPALDSFWSGSHSLQQAALANLGDQPDPMPDVVLGRLIRNLPEGPLLNWALRMANQHPSSQVAAARRDRGL